MGAAGDIFTTGANSIRAGAIIAAWEGAASFAGTNSTTPTRKSLIADSAVSALTNITDLNSDTDRIAGDDWLVDTLSYISQPSSTRIARYGSRSIGCVWVITGSLISDLLSLLD
jgi:hypothetical protein